LGTDRAGSRKLLTLKKKFDTAGPEGLAFNIA
jgi:hypothetical protein